MSLESTALNRARKVALVLISKLARSDELAEPGSIIFFRNHNSNHLFVEAMHGPPSSVPAAVRSHRTHVLHKHHILVPARQGLRSLRESPLGCLSRHGSRGNSLLCSLISGLHILIIIIRQTNFLNLGGVLRRLHAERDAIAEQETLVDLGAADRNGDPIYELLGRKGGDSYAQR